MVAQPPDGDARTYAVRLADGSYDWYRAAAIRSRRAHRISATTTNLIAAAIPVAAVVAPSNTVLTAALGSAILVVSGLRSTFGWHENYLRFSRAREAVEAQRRLYLTTAPPYDDPATKDQRLAAMVTKIEQEEMADWVRIASEHTRQSASPA